MQNKTVNVSSCKLWELYYHRYQHKTSWHEHLLQFFFFALSVLIIAVRPEVVSSILKFLQQSNHLYTDIMIDKSQITEAFLTIHRGFTNVVRKR